MNIEANDTVMAELDSSFRYNDAVLRNLVIRMDEAVSEESLIMKGEKESRERRERRPAREEAVVEADDSADDADSEE
jgi:small subunit ribosomal protein S6